MSEAQPAPLPFAGGVGGGQPLGEFKPRDTKRARALRNAATPAERRLWSVLSKRGLAGWKFSRQMPVGPYFADFLCREARLIVEVDGYSHDLRPGRDEARDASLATAGYATFRFTNAEVMHDLEGVARAITEALASRCPPPTPPASGRGGVQPLAAIDPEEATT